MFFCLCTSPVDKKCAGGRGQGRFRKRTEEVPRKFLFCSIETLAAQNAEKETLLQPLKLLKLVAKVFQTKRDVLPKEQFFHFKTNG